MNKLSTVNTVLIILVLVCVFGFLVLVSIFPTKEIVGICGILTAIVLSILGYAISGRNNNSDLTITINTSDIPDIEIKINKHLLKMDGYSINKGVCEKSETKKEVKPKKITDKGAVTNEN